MSPESSGYAVQIETSRVLSILLLDVADNAATFLDASRTMKCLEKFQYIHEERSSEFLRYCRNN